MAQPISGAGIQTHKFSVWVSSITTRPGLSAVYLLRSECKLFVSNLFCYLPNFYCCNYSSHIRSHVGLVVLVSHLAVPVHVCLIIKSFWHNICKIISILYLKKKVKKQKWQFLIPTLLKVCIGKLAFDGRSIMCNVVWKCIILCNR